MNGTFLGSIPLDACWDDALSLVSPPSFRR
jgi:hypothetical protein